MKPRIIVLGNEKGGTGKSTVAMHLAVYLLKAGFKVATIDLDARQGTFSRYFENRKNSPYTLELPQHTAIYLSDLENKNEAAKVEQESLYKALSDAVGTHFVVIDTPGTNTFLSRLAHSLADTLITPINDSFIDVDMLARLKVDTLDISHPSTYAEMVWAQRIERAKSKLKPTDWIIMRNRLSNLFSKNKKDINDVLEKLSKRIGFRLADGFCERVVFRELFLQGTTLLDFEEIGVPMSISHVSARQELRDVIKFLQMPELHLPPQ